MFLDSTEGGDEVLVCGEKTLMDLNKGSIILEEFLLRNELNGAYQSHSNVLWELYQWRLGQAKIGVLFATRTLNFDS